MSYAGGGGNQYDRMTTFEEIGAETLAEYERRAGVSAQMLLDAIRRDRVRHPHSDSCRQGNSPVCNVPEIEATGHLKKLEETKVYRMLIVLAEFRDGPPTGRFSLRHAYTAAKLQRETLMDWRQTHKLFDSLMESIQHEMVDTMRAEAYRRAVEGVDEPLVHLGVKTGDTIKKYSDQLLQFTLMGYDAKFRQKEVNMNVSGQLDTNINIEGLRDRLAQRLQQKAKAQEPESGA